MMKILRPQRWQDWFLIFAMLCLWLAALFSIFMILQVERPLRDELEGGDFPGSGSLGHFSQVGFAKVERMMGSLGALFIGVVLALIGCFKIPQKAMGTRKLRDVTWMTLILSFGIILVCSI